MSTRRGAAVGAEGAAPERRWISVPEFAAYLGVSDRQVWTMTRHDPDVRRVTKRIGRRVLICLWAWRQSVESGMVA